MAAFNGPTVVTTTTHVWSLDLPTNWVEVTKAFADIRQHLKANGVKEYDDTVTVRSDGEFLYMAVEDK